jgi:hypothetical protein
LRPTASFDVSWMQPVTMPVCPRVRVELEAGVPLVKSQLTVPPRGSKPVPESVTWAGALAVVGEAATVGVPPVACAVAVNRAVR